MNKKVAIPINENEVLEGHFGQTRLFAIYLVKDGKIESKETLTPPPHAPGVLPKWLRENEVTDVLVNSMGERASKILSHFNVNVMLGAPVLTSDEIVQGFIDNTIEFTNELCLHEHHHHHHHHDGGGRGQGHGHGPGHNAEHKHNHGHGHAHNHNPHKQIKSKGSN